MTIPVRIEADYLIESPIDPRRAAETMAGEQSSGTFVAVPGETPELRRRAAREDRAARRGIGAIAAGGPGQSILAAPGSAPG